MDTAVNNPNAIFYEQDGISLYDNTRMADSGKLTVTESAFTWSGASINFALSYNQLTLHAISKLETIERLISPNGDHNPSNFTLPHMLVMVDGQRPWVEEQEDAEMVEANGNENGGVELTTNGDDHDDSGSDRASDCPGETTILRFVPQDSRALEGMYNAVADCQALNPDTDSSVGDEDDESWSANNYYDCEKHGMNPPNGDASDNEPDQFGD